MANGGILASVIIIIIIMMARANADNESKCPSPCSCGTMPSTTDDASVVVTCETTGIDNKQLQQLLVEMPANVTKLVIIGEHPIGNTFSLSRDLVQFKRLAELHLINCGIPSLGKHLFADMKQLRILNLAHNRIDFVTESSFAGLDQLHALDLSHNRLTERMPTGAFRRLRNLRSLSLAYNHMTQLSSNLFSGLDQLVELVLDGNRPPPMHINSMLIELPATLRRLELNHCHLRSLNGVDFSRSAAIRRLGIGWNELGSVPTSVLRPLVNLTSLDLSGNSIVNIDKCAFCGEFAHALGTLALGYNQLGDASDFSFFRELSQLTELDLSYNKFSGRFASAHILGTTTNDRIRVLDISGNALANIQPSLIAGMHRLTSLHISNIGIDHLPPQLPTEFHQLLFLNLSSNALHHFEHHLPNLRSLDLSANRFTSLPIDTMTSTMPALHTIHLDGNPWDCRCHLASLRRYLLLDENVSRRRALNYHRVQCASPTLMLNQSIASLERPLDCAILFGATYGISQSSELGILIAIVAGCALLVVALVLATIAYYTRERRYKGTYETREERPSAHRCSSSSDGSSPDETHHDCLPIYKTPDYMPLAPPPPRCVIGIRFP